MLEISTIVFMIVILGFMWGGLIYFVNRAYRREKMQPESTSDIDDL